jgi:DHA1 family bicyclomycin/chloramphenicol resistance-like MFS transporter
MSAFAVGPLVGPLVSLNGPGPVSMSVTMTAAYIAATLLAWTTIRPRRPALRSGSGPGGVT